MIILCETKCYQISKKNSTIKRGPYNYSTEVWVDLNDMDAVDERFVMVENADLGEAMGEIAKYAGLVLVWQPTTQPEMQEQPTTKPVLSGDFPGMECCTVPADSMQRKQESRTMYGENYEVYVVEDEGE